MLNKNKFRAMMVGAGETVADVARLLGRNEATIFRKINGESDFDRGEIQIMKVHYLLDAEDVAAIFFADELTKT